MMNDETEPKSIQMTVLAAKTHAGEFVFDMKQRNNTTRVVRFSLEQADAEELFTALKAHLGPKEKAG